jgi:phosphoenolpyruvate synthase/pyruvate phosphate dikinase
MHKVQREPYITRTPHDRRLIKLSEKIQKHLGHRCEIEYVVSEEGQIYVVQAKDISHIETLWHPPNQKEP